MLRKSLYPEQYPEMVEYYSNGTINHNTLAALHMGIYIHSYLSVSGAKYGG
jgi:hypothetical protein